MTTSTRISLDTIIKEKKLTVYFQPIVANKSTDIFAYEALIRGPIDTPFHSPLALFEEATKQGRLVELELLCRSLSIQQFQSLKLDGKLFLNASPDTLFQPGFRGGETLRMLEKANLSASRVVIELTEHSPLDNYQMVREAIKHYKNMGFEIAMDDLGSGYSGLRMWDELRPDYVKIDRYFVSNIGVDKVRQQFVLSIKNIADELNCKVIAEGIETEDEFRFIEKMGLPFSQGYYFAKPAALPVRKIPKKLFFSDANAGITLLDPSTPIVAELLQHIPAVSEHDTVEQCANLFKLNRSWESIPVVRWTASGQQKPLGLIRRSCLTKLLFLKFGRELSGKKSIQSLVDTNVMMLEKYLAIEQVSQAINQQSEAQKALEFIITKQGNYEGVGSIIALVKMISNLQITNARYANPLTLLPGNVPINKKLEQYICAEYPFVIAYIDLDNFKPYNDYYGYEKGDQIITGVANILREVVTEPHDFIGHIGGDDFIIITSNELMKSICEAILTKFSEWVRHRYLPEDQVMGGISAKDRFGKDQFYPMLTLSIGCVEFPSPFCTSYHDVAVLATDAKSMAKKQKGNSVYIANAQVDAANCAQYQQPNAAGIALSA
ncbi:GGDEF domain-containing protein [Psychromonas marina]|uniref:GGDEF domain-containing protein n=1 Tax=Psychromonas marina TaxID=88364 RepID=A0ABQ6DX91_9GAMM|nr:GGDEF domain-containing protein [Psychromonas marina]GLS89595.1 GGDEF domain-containing protein [Psychromonas marina]